MRPRLLYLRVNTGGMWRHRFHTFRFWHMSSVGMFQPYSLIWPRMPWTSVFHGNVITVWRILWRISVKPTIVVFTISCMRIGNDSATTHMAVFTLRKFPDIWTTEFLLRASSQSVRFVTINNILRLSTIKSLLLSLQRCAAVRFTGAKVTAVSRRTGFDSSSTCRTRNTRTVIGSLFLSIVHHNNAVFGKSTSHGGRRFARPRGARTFITTNWTRTSVAKRTPVTIATILTCWPCTIRSMHSAHARVKQMRLVRIGFWITLGGSTAYRIIRAPIAACIISTVSTIMMNVWLTCVWKLSQLTYITLRRRHPVLHLTGTSGIPIIQIGVVRRVAAQQTICLRQGVLPPTGNGARVTGVLGSHEGAGAQVGYSLALELRLEVPIGDVACEVLGSALDAVVRIGMVTLGRAARQVSVVCTDLVDGVAYVAAADRAAVVKTTKTIENKLLHKPCDFSKP